MDIGDGNKCQGASETDDGWLHWSNVDFMKVRIADKMYATKNRIIKKNVLSGVNSNKLTYGVNQLNFDLSS